MANREERIAKQVAKCRPCRCGTAPSVTESMGRDGDQPFVQIECPADRCVESFNFTYATRMPMLVREYIFVSNRAFTSGAIDDCYVYAYKRARKSWNKYYGVSK